VIDHMGMVDVEKGLDGPETAALLTLMARPQVWVKLTVCRVARTAAALEKLAPLHRAMAEAAADRALWGSDWPYVRMEPAPDAGALLDLFHAWTDDAGLRQAILVDNPARLFGFSGDGDLG
jgi:2-pyrone-4,6-dicarboxylate lactonase